MFPEPLAALGKAKMVIIGASAGGVAALLQILPDLPEDYPLPVLIVVHQPAQSLTGLAELFAFRCRLRVKEAEDKERASEGTVYFAPPDYHLLVERDGLLSLSKDEPVNFSRPSIDVLFESAADTYGPALLAVVLTGANEDGAQGMAAVCAAGGIGVVQAPETAEVRTMPEAALVASESARAMSLEEIVRIMQIAASPKT